MSMHALRLLDGKIVFDEDAPLPTINDGDDADADSVVIEVAYSGICGTDLHIIAGEFPSAPPPEDAARGLIMGHEISGYVRAVGRNVDPALLPIGALCTLNPNGQCGACQPCRAGQPHFCQQMKHPGCGPVGVYRHGGWATHLKVPAARVYALPAGMDVREAVLCEPYSCILRGYAQLNRAGQTPLQSHTRILILGGGIIGMLWALLLRHRGQRLLTISEPSEARRAVVERAGFRCVDPASLPASSSQLGEYDVLVDCSGYPPAIQQALPLLGCGGRLLLFGCCPKGSSVAMDPYEVFDRELVILGAKVNPFTFAEAVQLVADLAEQLDFKSLGIMDVLLREYNLALDMLKQRSISKAVFRFPCADDPPPRSTSATGGR